MSTAPGRISYERLDSLSPFSISCAEDLTIERIGPGLRKVFGRDLAGSELLDEFAIERPTDVLKNAADIRSRTRTTFLLRARDSGALLRCQPMVSDPDENGVVFFGTLAVSSQEDLESLGLTYADLAPSDPTPDLLTVKQRREAGLGEVERVNTDLERAASRLRSETSAMAEIELRYRTLVEQQPLVTYIDTLGEDIETAFISDNVLGLTGYPSEWWRSEPNIMFRIMHPDDAEAVRIAHRRSARNGEPYKGDFRFVKPDGSVVWVQAEDRPVTDEDGRQLYRLGYLVDITQRRATEEELRQTGSRLRALIGSLQSGILLEDENRKVALSNQGFCDIFGIPAAPEQIVGADCELTAEQSKVLAVDPDAFIARIRAILAVGLPVDSEEVEFADGRVFERDYVPILVDGARRGHLWAYRDVTSRIAAQRAIEDAHDEAVAASLAKSEFLATVSHEVRTPMHGVLGTVDLLQRTKLDAEQAELASIIKTSASALLDVINDILDLQRAEAGRIEIAEQPVDVGLLVAEVVDTFRAAAASKQLSVAVKIDDRLPSDLLGDPGRLRQILVNLVANAIKFTETGTVTISFGLTHLEDLSATLRLTVSDTGMGIAPEQQERIFEPFAQVDSSSARRHEGTGLGLAITSRLVHLMNGSIGIDSQLGEGTTVTASIRLRRGAAQASAPHDLVTSVPKLSGSVLVVEDNLVNREIATRQLERLGVDVYAVDSGAAALEALDALDARRYDAVLMDMRMPGLTGVETARVIRSQERATGRPRMAIVAMTANAMPEDREACLDAGMDDFATKPLSLADLAMILGPWLNAAGEVSELRVSGAEPSAPADEEAGDALTIAETLGRMASELGSSGAVRRVVEVWLQEVPSRISELQQAANDGDAERLGRGAHTLKSTSALVGAISAATLAAGIERRVADGVMPTDDQLCALAKAVDSAAELVAAWVRALPETAAG